VSLKIESVAVESLVPDPNNARKHSDANLSAIASSLKEFGQRKPIVVTADNVIVAGNGTVEAARVLGITSVDVVRVPRDWSAEQATAFALADNRSAELAEWIPEVLSAQLVELAVAGFDVEALGFDVAVEDAPVVEGDDDVKFDDVIQRASLGDCWRVGEHEVVCGDASDLSVVARFGVEFDAVITDPPYGIGANKQSLGNGKKAFHRGEGWDDKAPDIAFVLELAPVQIIWGGNYFADQLPANNHWLIWYKKIANVSFSECEMAWTNLGKQVRLLAHHWSGEEKQHVTMKPSPVMDWCCSFVDKGANVLDVYAGAGSTLLAADRAGQVGFGVEIDPKYVDVILERLEKQTGQKAVLLNDSR